MPQPPRSPSLSRYNWQIKLIQCDYLLSKREKDSMPFSNLKALSLLWDYLQTSLVRWVLALRDPFPAWFFQRTMVLHGSYPSMSWGAVGVNCSLEFGGSRALLGNVRRTWKNIKIEWFYPGTSAASILFQFPSWKSKKKKWAWYEEAMPKFLED